MPARFLLLLLLIPAAAYAQGGRDSTVALPDVTVTATRTETPAALVPARVTLLDAGAVEASGARSVADLLEARAPVFVKRYGAGGLATLSLRGSGAEQTLILLDGHRIADPQLGQLDLSLLPTLLVSSVEVMHGAASSLYGTDAIGGVVNLRTLPSTGAPEARLFGEYGAFGERGGGLLLSSGTGRLYGTALAEHTASEGDFPYTVHVRDQAHHLRRIGADAERTSLYAGMGYRGERHHLRLTGWYNAAARGLPRPGLAVPDTLGERQWDEHLRLWADDWITLPRGALRVGGLLQRGALRYADPRAGIDDLGRTLIASADVQLDRAVSARWLLSGGVTGGYAAADHPSLAGATDLHAGAFIHAAGDFGRVRFYPALRADAYAMAERDALTALSPRLGVNVQPVAGWPVYLKGSAGRSFRTPTLNARYWRPGGDPGLRPERGWSYDGGVFHRHRRGRTEVSVFANHTTDEIVWLPSGSISVARNVGRVRRYGVEASSEWAWALAAGREFSAGFAYGYVDARDRTDPVTSSYGKQLRYVPREQIKGFAGLRLGPAALDLAGRYTGRRYTASDASAYLDPFFVLDAQIRLEHRLSGVRAQLLLAAENLLNAEYEVVAAHPMPPRHARLRLLLDFFPPGP